jgi:adenosine deaminase CECR1
MPSLLLAVVLAASSTSSARFETIKREASSEELYRFLYALPKGGDLHNHLGGAGFPPILSRLATDRTVNGNQTFYTRVRINDCDVDCGTPLYYFLTFRESHYQELPECCRMEYEPLDELSADELEAWQSAMKIDEPTEGRNEFFEALWPRLNDVLEEASILAELAVENMKLFADEGVRYVEFQISPFGRRAGGHPISPDEMHEILVARLSKPDATATGVTVRFQTNVLRFSPRAEEMVEASYAFVDRHRDWWSSVNLVGREDNDKGYPLRFLETFRKMRRRYPDIPMSIHGGEVDEPNRHVRDTLLLGADRIGHGTNLVTDPDTLLLLRSGQFPIEVSLVSNQLLRYASPDEHPFPEYLRLGIPVCLSTDDRGMWDSNMTDEYFNAVTAYNLSWDELIQLGRSSLRFAFVSEENKAALLRSYEEDVEAFRAQYLGDDWRERLAEVPAQPTGYARKYLLGR